MTMEFLMNVRCKLSDQKSDDEITSINSKDNDDDAVYIT